MSTSCPQIIDAKTARSIANSANEFKVVWDCLNQKIKQSAYEGGCELNYTFQGLLCVENVRDHKETLIQAGYKSVRIEVIGLHTVRVHCEW